MAKVTTRTYILNMKDGSRQKITVPTTWRVTFGALYPGKDLNSGKSAMRFYEKTKDNQRMVVTEVESFRDSSVEIEIEVVRSSDQAAKVQTPAGEKTVIMRGEVREWVDPDDPKQTSSEVQFLRPGASDQKLLSGFAEQAEAAALSKHPFKR